MEGTVECGSRSGLVQPLAIAIGETSIADDSDI